MADRQQELMALLDDFGFCMAKCAVNRSGDVVEDPLLVRSLDSRNFPWFDRLVSGNTAQVSWNTQANCNIERMRQGC